MADGSSSDGGPRPSPGGQPAAYRAFRSLVESAERKFARVRDLPAHGRERHPHCQRKVFKAYTRVWRFQQEHRRELLEAGMRRWEIGEVASRIGQLYYSQYLRTSDVRFLLEAFVFYEAILSRGYFESGRGKAAAAATGGKQQMLSDLGVRCKELRFYARFALVALLLDRREMVGKLVERLRALVDDCRVAFPGTNFKEWRQVLHEIARFSKASTGFTTSRPLRYSALFDSHPSLHSYVARFRTNRALRLQEVLLASYYQNEVKFSEFTLDTFRMLQCLEWEPDGSTYQVNATESTDKAAFNEQSGASGLININLAADVTDPSLLPNPRKSILHHPSVSHLIAVIAATCEEVSPDGIFLIYLSASGKSDQTVAFRKENHGVLRNVHTSSQNCGKRDNALSHSPFFNRDQNDCCRSGLWFGSQGNNGLDYLYPSDLIPFTRSPLFLIIDSDNSHAFKVIYGQERGETAVLLLSPERSTSRNSSTADLATNQSQFTFFLTCPLQAFCELVGHSDIDQHTYNNAETILSAALAQWEVILCTSGSLNQEYAQVLSDPFLRRLILRFIFCRSALSLFCLPGKGSQYLPDCLPDLPDSLSPNSSSVQSGILQLADSLGVASHFHFFDSIESSTHRKQ